MEDNEEDIVRIEDIRSSRLRVIRDHLTVMVERQDKVVERLEAAGQEFYDETALWEVTDNKLDGVLAQVNRVLKERGDHEP